MYGLLCTTGSILYFLVLCVLFWQKAANAEVTNKSTGAPNCVVFVANDVKNQFRFEPEVLLVPVGPSRQLADTEIASFFSEEKNYVLRRKNAKTVLSFSFDIPKIMNNWVAVDKPIETLVTGDSISCESLRVVKNWEKLRRDTTQKVFSAHSKPSVGLGHAILNMEYIYLWEKHGRKIDLNSARVAYDRILNHARESLRRDFSSSARFFSAWKDLLGFLYSDSPQGLDLNYCRENTLLFSALYGQCTNCVGETSLMLALVHDLGFKPNPSWQLAFELFRDHIRPVFFNSGSGAVYDLAYGVFDRPQGAVHPFRSFLLANLKGFNGLLHPLETQALVRYDKDPIWSPFFCLGGWFDLGPLIRDQLPNFSGFKSCGGFGRGEPPDHADNAFRSTLTSFENRSDSHPASLAATAAGESPGDSVFEFSSIYAYLSETVTEVVGSRHWLDTMIAGDYRSYLEQLSPEEKQIVSNFGELRSERKARQFVDHFNNGHLLRHLGIHLDAQSGSKALGELLGNLDCQALPFLSLNFDASVEDFFYTGGDVLSLPNYLSEVDVDAHSVQYRYQIAFDKLEISMRQRLALVHEAFGKKDFKGLLNAIDEQSIHLTLLPRELVSYRELIARLFKACDHPSKKILIDRLLSSTFLLGYKETIARVLDFSRRIESAPVEFLTSLTEHMDQSGNFDFALAWERNLSNEIFYLAEILGLDSKAQTFHFQPRSLFHGFLYSLLFHPDYFFTGPPDETDPFGGVRPLWRLNLAQLREKKSNFPQMPDIVESIQLPKILVDPCDENESGFVDRGLFTIVCQPEAERASSIHNHTVGERENQTRDGLDETGNDLAIDEAYRKLTPSAKAVEVLPEGSVEGHGGSTEKSSHIDKRTEVTIEPRFWRTLGELLLRLQDGSEMSLAIHHLLRPSIKRDFLSFKPHRNNPVIFAEEMSLDYLVWSDHDLEDTVDQIHKGKISMKEALELAKDDIELRLLMQDKNQMPFRFLRSPVHSTIYQSFSDFSRPGWFVTSAEFMAPDKSVLKEGGDYRFFRWGGSALNLDLDWTNSWEIWSDHCQTPNTFIADQNALVCSKKASVSEMIGAFEKLFRRRVEQLELQKKL